MATDIYFVTDLQNAQQLTELLNEPESIVNFNPCSADIKEKRKSIFSKKKKTDWPASVDALRKVVLFSKQRKAHFEIAQVSPNEWQIIDTPIEEVYVRNLKTLRVVPWLQKLYMPDKKGKKKKLKMLLPPAAWTLKSKNNNNNSQTPPPIPTSPKPLRPASQPSHASVPRPQPQPPVQQQQPQQQPAAAAAAAPAEQRQRDAADLHAFDGEANAYAAGAIFGVGGARVNVVGSANDLFGDDGELKSAAEIGSAAARLQTVREDHREAFPGAQRFRSQAYNRPGADPALIHDDGGPGGAWSTWPPPKQRSRGNHLAACAAAADNSAGTTQSQRLIAEEAEEADGDGVPRIHSMRASSTTKHEKTLRDIVGVDDAVLAWEAQRKGAAGDQAAALNAAREDLEERVRRQQEEQEAAHACAHAAEKQRRAERAEEARRQAEFQAALRAEQKKLQAAAKLSLQRQALARSGGGGGGGGQRYHPHSQPAPRPPLVSGGGGAEYDDRGAAATSASAGGRIVYPAHIVRRGSSSASASAAEPQQHLPQREESEDSSDGDQPDMPVPAYHQSREAAAMWERNARRDTMRSQPDWQEKVDDLANFGGVSNASAEAVLENFHGNLKAGKLYFLERMSFA
jgi:hypothetical protein